MTEDVTNIVLEHLRDIRNRLNGVEASIQQLTMRFGAVEGHLAQNSELDRVKQRLDRIERRLELQGP